MNNSPIFIHSLFRSGSTYLFKVFRRSTTGYWCYQEPLHEIPVFSKEQPAGLITGFGSVEMELNRHPVLERPYFQELFETWPAWKNVINERIVYEAYFADEGWNSDIGIAYWRALIDAAKGLPVFQECRTAGRIAAIKQQLGGFHLYLWRNPWDQWWSYKVTTYFDVANQLIINARHVPASVQRMRAELNLATYAGNDLAGAFSFYSRQPLTSDQSYLVFYLLWCLAMREGSDHADLLLNIDRLSDSDQYRRDIVSQLSSAGIADIDFSDCSVPQARYLPRDIRFFDRLEKQVHLWLEESGWTAEDLNRVQTLRLQSQPASWAVPINELAQQDLAEQALRARELAIRSETSTAERTLEARTQLSEVDARLVAARVAALQGESMAQQAEAKAQQAEAKAQQAEAKAQQAEARGRDDRARADLIDLELNAILNSRSWRVTRPLRWASALMVGFQSDARDDSPLRAFSTRTLRRGIGFLGRHPKLKNIAVSFLKKLPPLERRLRFLSSIHETRIHNQERIDATEKLATSILNEGSILNQPLYFSQKETAKIMDLLAQALNESSEAHYLARRKRTG